MKQIITPADVAQLGTILAIWAHPDDETYTAAGLLAAAVDNGQKVACVTATKGEAGVQDESRWPAAQLGDIRETELQAALQILGIRHHRWLGYHDGHCAEVDANEAIQKIQALIAQHQPDTIITFGPDGLTGHPDHCTVSSWVQQASAGSDIAIYHVMQEEQAYHDLKEADKQFNIFFNIEQPRMRPRAECDIALVLPPALQERKLAALGAMPSQTEALLGGISDKATQALIACECFVRASPA